MDRSSLNYSLIDVIKVTLKWKNYILAFAFAAAIISAIYFFLKKNEYRAYGSFYPAASVLSGRINLFRENQDWIDFYGGETEVDRAYVIGNSSNVIDHLIKKFDFAKHYNIDVKEDKKGALKVAKRFAKKFSLTRSGYKHIEITFTDEDNTLAAMVVNETMARIEQLTRDFYKDANNRIANAIDNRADSISNQLVFYTDSLIKMRVKYNFYDIVSPGRSNLMLSAGRGSGLNYAKGLEEVQNLEEIKDKLAVSKARYMTFSNEFRTANYHDFPMVHVVQSATPSASKAGPFRTLNVAISFGAALILGILLALFVESFAAIKAKIV